RSLFSRAVVYGVIILLGLLSALPNVLPDNLLQKLPDWYAGNQITLGLDLRGGSHLLLAVDSAQLQENSNQTLADKLSDELRIAKIRHDKIQVDNTGLRLAVNDAALLKDVARIARALIKEQASPTPLYQFDEQGRELILTSTEAHQQLLMRDAVERRRGVVRRRLDETGMVEPMITRQGKDSILVQFPGVDDPTHIRTLLGTTASMSFHWVANHTSIGDVISVPGQLPSENYRLEKRVAL